MSCHEILTMAVFIGSELRTGNWGEDYFVEKLMEYLDDSYVIYRNRPMFGAQFDVALFAPRVGIIIFEVFLRIAVDHIRINTVITFYEHHLLAGLRPCDLTHYFLVVDT